MFTMKSLVSFKQIVIVNLVMLQLSCTCSYNQLEGCYTHRQQFCLKIANIYHLCQQTASIFHILGEELGPAEKLTAHVFIQFAEKLMKLILKSLNRCSSIMGTIAVLDTNCK